MSLLRRIAAIAMAAAAVVTLTATPASAHTVEGAGPTNYLTRLKAVTPARPGLEIRILEFGSRIEVRNTTAEELVVLGYSGEPYLRIGPRGVSQNMRSRATYLNADRQGETQVPETADPEAEPRWAFVSREPVARWHDHRVHWMGEEPPAAVENAPGREHTIYKAWEVPMTLGGDPLVASGDLRWVPPGSPLPWIALAVGSAALMIGGSITGRWRLILGLGTAVLVVVGVVQAIGIAYAPSTTGSPIGRLSSGSLYLLPAWLSGVFGARNLLTKKGDGALAAVLCAVIVGFIGGVLDIGALFSSQVAFAWSSSLARLFVALALGLGVGVFVGDVIAFARHEKPKLADGAGNPG
jgi:hypothetical protein